MQTKLKVMREERGWSQEKLAEMAGLSTRTIQRIESGKRVGLESWLSLSSVFEMPVKSLQGETMESNTEQLMPEELKALKIVRKRRSFYISLIRYVVIVLCLLVINLATSDYLWVGWVAFGWGIGLACKAFVLLTPFKWFDDEWERKEVEKILGKRI